MSRIEVSSPPGVSSCTMRAWWPSRSARSSTSRMWSAITGVITPSTVTTMMLEARARAGDPTARSRPTMTRSNQAATRDRRRARARTPASGMEGPTNGHLAPSERIATPSTISGLAV